MVACLYLTRFPFVLSLLVIFMHSCEFSPLYCAGEPPRPAMQVAPFLHHGIIAERFTSVHAEQREPKVATAARGQHLLTNLVTTFHSSHLLL